jgi:hypothetical protein
VRADSSDLTYPDKNSVGVWVANYTSRSVTIANVNIQGTHVGVMSPFYYGQASASSRHGSLTVENGYFRTEIGVNIATGYFDGEQGRSLKTAIVRGSVFELLNLSTPDGRGGVGPEAISMNYGMRLQDTRPREPILVYDYNKQAGNNFKVY